MQRYFGVMRSINNRSCKKLLDTVVSEPRESMNYTFMEMINRGSRPGCASILRESGIPELNEERKNLPSRM